MTDRTWELMQQHLETGVYEVFSSQDSAPSAETLREIAHRLGCEIPEEFVVHSTNKYGGLYVDVKEELWPRPREFDVGPFWSFLYGLYTLNSAEGIPQFMDLELQARRFQEETGYTAIPFLKMIGDADVYCFDQSGAIVRWDHELNELEQVEKTFFEVLDVELAELVDRKDRKTSQQQQPDSAQ